MPKIKPKQLATNGADLIGVKLVYFAQYDYGNIGGSPKIIDWTLGHHQKATLVGNVANVTFVAPSGPAVLRFLLTDDGNGYAKAFRWPTSGIKWPYGVTRGPVGAPGSVSLFSFYYDGTSYHGVSVLDLF